MANDAEGKRIEDGAVKEVTRPRSWWQWMLVYPGLLIAVAGSLPTWVEAVKSYSFDVPFGQTSYAKEQNKLWQGNFECAQKASFTPITNKLKVEIASVVCETGDVLLRGKRPEWDSPQYRWVSWSDVAKPNKVSLTFFLTAHANETKNLFKVFLREGRGKRERSFAEMY